MRNLRNTKHARFKFSSSSSAALSATAWDVSDDSLILCFGPESASDPSITLKRLPSQAYGPDDAVQIASWDAPSPDPQVAVDRVVDVHCFPDTKTICLVLAGGDIIVVREDPQPGEDLISIVGSVDAGICAAAWSPDEEVLAIATAAETLIFMTRDLQGVANVTLEVGDVKVSNHVSVGWGKKETQFKGRGAAKASRDPTVPEHVDEGALSDFDDGGVRISWRGDGEVLAVNCVLETEPRRRVIRMYSREGKLESVSEPVNGLEGAVSWKPGGQVIAGIRRREEGVDVVFFERNGLRHGEFSLRLHESERETVGGKIELAWNGDGSVLAVSLLGRVQLWTTSNYHWYLKQEIRFNINEPLGAATAPRCLWHPETRLTLALTNGDELRRLSYKFEVCRGPVTPPNDLGIVAVIDGNILKITPLRVANVPPPMAFDEVELPATALDAYVSGDGREIIVLHDQTVSVWECDYSLKPAKRARLREVVDRSTSASEKSAWAAVSEHRHLYVRTDHDRISYSHEGHAVSTLGSTSDGKISTNGTSTPLDPYSSQEEISIHQDDAGTLHLQTPQQNLRILGCTSFIVTPDLLIYTTTQHLLKFIYLYAAEISIPPDILESDERCRKIERGAKIVTVIRSACSLILQMPRGNLETIYPRALVLANVRASIDVGDYRAAFLACRTHRVDMNILHDLKPEQFMGSIETFVGQMDKLEYMDLFLSSLVEEDVCETLYRGTLRGGTAAVNGTAHDDSAQHRAPTTSSKVNKICDAILSVLLQKHLPSRVQNVVTAHVSKNPPDLASGLNLILTLSSQKDTSSTLEQAVEHICFLADVNELYDTALGMYELEVALLIAQQSQKDPREYMPYLEALNEMEPLRRRFRIDDDLKRYTKAVGHLCEIGDFEEIRGYVRKHELYSTGLRLYRYDEVRLVELMRMYADYLSSQSKWKDAGTAYEYVADHASAYEAFRAANLWRECLSNAVLASLPQNKLASLAEDIANALDEAKDFTSAAIIHLDYLKDLEGCARLLCKAYDFAEAMRLVTVHGRAELLSPVVDPGLIEASATTTEMLADMKSQLNAQVPRLRELRQKKIEDPMAFLDGADGAETDIPDNLSLAPTDASTSGSTFMTQYTNRSTGTLGTNATRKTSKNRRREERKRARGKKGTVYEEEYLVNSVARLVERLNDVGEEAERLVQGLMRRAMRERAVAVQAALEEVHGMCGESLAEVFAQGMENETEQSQEKMNEEKRPWGGQGVLFDATRGLNSLQNHAPPILKPLTKPSSLLAI